MAFYVVGPDGNKYGPADVPTLQQWVGEGRVTSNTLLEEEGTGRQGYASTVPGLSFAADGSADPMTGAPTYANSIPTQMPNAYVPNPQMNQPVQPLYGQQNPNAMPMTPGGVMGYSIPVNTSGTDGELPAEIAAMKWNWGAFALTWMWLAGNNYTKAAIGMIIFDLFYGIVNYGMMFAHIGVVPGLLILLHMAVSIVIGRKGNQIAWSRKRFDSVQAFIAAQKTWMILGCICAVIYIPITLYTVYRGLLLNPAPVTFQSTTTLPSTGN